MSRVAVHGHMLQWALKRSQLKVEHIISRFPRIHEWLMGSVYPTLKQLESFANATRTPFGYLLLDEPPVEDLPIPDFRTLDDVMPRNPSPDLLDTIYTMQYRQAWLREELVEQGAAPLEFVGSVTLEDDPVAVAQKMRQVLGIATGWAATEGSWRNARRTLASYIEDAGIIVVINGVVGNNNHRRLSPEEFRGFVLVDRYAPFLFVNGSDGKAAQLFTMAHELAHIFYGSSGAFDLREMQPTSHPLEQACNRAAAEFLVPEIELRALWTQLSDDPGLFEKGARHFKVSDLVIARRALDLGLINSKEFSNFYTGYLEDEHRARSQTGDGGNYYANQNFRVGRSFAVEVMHATAEGRLLFSEAYALTGLYGETFRKYARELGMEGLS